MFVYFAKLLESPTFFVTIKSPQTTAPKEYEEKSRLFIHSRQITKPLVLMLDEFPYHVAICELWKRKRRSKEKPRSAVFDWAESH